jgi:excisionase family DNA binding protein
VFSVTDLPPKWSEDAATFRRRGQDYLARFIESFIGELEAEIRSEGGEALSIPRGASEEQLGDYTVAQVAGIFQRSPQTVRDWINARRMRAYKFNGREYRITRAAVEEFREQQRNGTTDTRPKGQASTADLGVWRDDYRPASVS